MPGSGLLRLILSNIQDKLPKGKLSADKIQKELSQANISKENASRGGRKKK